MRSLGTTLPFSGESWLVRGFLIAVISWYLIDSSMFAIIGVLTDSWNMVLTSAILTVWFIMTVLLHQALRQLKLGWKVTMIFYLPFIFILSGLEEFFVYSIGGGLGGKAESLLHDFTLALPMFVFVGGGLLLSWRLFKMSAGEVFLSGAVIGLIIEVVMPLNLFYSWLFGGAALGIYGLLYWTAVPLVDRKNTNGRSALNILGGALIGMIFAVISGVIGSWLWIAIG